MYLSTRTASLFCLLLIACPVFAQDRSAGGDPATAPAGLGEWAPAGRIPVDQAGAGFRGYVLTGESTEVAEPGADQISIHAVATNNFYREQTNDLSITQRYETHTVALGYRRGFRFGMFPRVEVGGQIQLTERDSGFMNGFISGSENFLAWLTGQQSARNPFRRGVATQLPLGTLLTKSGQPVYQAAGSGAGFGDFTVVAKALLRDDALSSGRTRVAVRLAANMSGKSQFAGGNFTGIGLSVDKRVFPWAGFHADLRASVLLDRRSQLNLPLKHASWGFSVGPELRLTRNSSAIAQIDGSTTPYLATGTTAFDKGYGDIALGVNHRSGGLQRQFVTQVYVRENMNLPFRVRWNTDPDLSLGIHITMRSAPH